MTARASEAFCSSPAPPIAIGTIPTIIAAAVISTGRIRVWPALSAASKAVCPFSCCSRAKVTSKIEFAEATPTTLLIVPYLFAMLRKGNDGRPHHGVFEEVPE